MPVLPPVMMATLPARRFIAVARPSGHHLRPRASGDGLGDAIQRGDHRGDASALDELDGGLDLGPHAAGRELAGGEETVSLAHGEPVEEAPPGRAPADGRSEEHTSELQSRVELVCRLLLEKKKTSAQRSAAPA